jgi:hypothetical protein
MAENRIRKGMEILPSLHRKLKAMSSERGLPMWVATETAFRNWIDMMSAGDQAPTEKMYRQVYSFEDESLLKSLHTIRQEDPRTADVICSLIESVAKIVRQDRGSNIHSADAQTLVDDVKTAVASAASRSASRESESERSRERTDPPNPRTVRRRTGA